MLGWEFPPFHSGGLGIACEGLIKALARQNVKVVLLLPEKLDYRFPFCKIIFAESSLKRKNINPLLSPYITSSSYQKLSKNIQEKEIFGSELFAKVLRYTEKAKKISLLEDFDIIHAHDWLTFPAGLEIKKISKKPLISHIHATEFDRTGGNNINQTVYEIEKAGLMAADRVVTVSNFTKNKLIKHYNISPEKITVIYNAIDFCCFSENNLTCSPVFLKKNQKIVLFAGRITLQKGPDYFVEAAKKVLEKNPNVIFIIAGAGDMRDTIIEKAANLDIADKVLFTGFLEREKLFKLYQLADLYLLPSVSEPFGLTPLEALMNGAPVLISKQSGVSEVLFHCLKVDFWDIEEMANKILAVLQYPELYQTLKENGSQEVKKFSWEDSAKKIIEVYQKVLSFS